jgi:CheY-like chemotaxis protein
VAHDAIAATDVSTDTLKFLVVDALAGVQSFSRQLLLSHGFAPESILCCSDPESALAKGLDCAPSLLVTDWFGKSALTGVALAERLKAAVPGLHLGFLSFECTPEHEAQAKAMGAHFLLKKPFTAEQLRAEVGRALEAMATQLPAVKARLQPAAAGVRAGATAGNSSPPPRPRVVAPVLPPAPIVKPGDQVVYGGNRHTVMHVVHRHGETVLQLKGQTSFVPVDKVTMA